MEAVRAKMVEAARHLEEHGWAVVPEVLSPEQANELLDQLWITLEAVSLGRVKRADPTTWRGDTFFKAPLALASLS
jgi:DNA-directed RNA polymerase subunit H (RpoH/RPB5)